MCVLHNRSSLAWGLSLSTQTPTEADCRVCLHPVERCGEGVGLARSQHRPVSCLYSTVRWFLEASCPTLAYAHTRTTLRNSHGSTSSSRCRFFDIINCGMSMSRVEGDFIVAKVNPCQQTNQELFASFATWYILHAWHCLPVISVCSDNIYVSLSDLEIALTCVLHRCLYTTQTFKHGIKIANTENWHLPSWNRHGEHVPSNFSESCVYIQHRWSPRTAYWNAVFMDFSFSLQLSPLPESSWTRSKCRALLPFLRTVDV